jgi:hypothetical protein
MQSKFKPKVSEGEEASQLMYATNGTNFSMNPEVDPAQMPEEGKSSSLKKPVGIQKGK